MTESSGVLFEQLLDLIARLRGPNGCPWDRAQTRTSLKPYLIEETYEVLEAIDEQDPAKLREELGDLILQVVFHAQMAEESGAFTIADVLAAINDKLVRRHPHVFGDEKAETAQLRVNATQNEFRGTLKDQAAELMPRAETALLVAGLQSQINALGGTRREGVGLSIDVIAKLAMFLIATIALIVSVYLGTNGGGVG